MCCMIDNLTINCTLKDYFESKPYTTVASNISTMNKSTDLHSSFSAIHGLCSWTMDCSEKGRSIICSAQSADYIYVCISMLYA